MDKLSNVLGEIFEEIQIKADEKKKACSLADIKKAVEDKRIYYHPSPIHILIGQIKFSAGYFMLLQCICGILMIIFIYHMKASQNSIYDYLAVLSAFAAFINVFMMVEVSRSFSYQMAETEQACYLNLKQLYTCKMICFGATELLLLSGFLIVLGKDMEVGIFRFGVYIMVPFLISNLIYLVVFTEFRRIKNEYIPYILAFLLGIAATVPARFPKIYESANFGIWIILLLTALIGLGYEGYRMVKGMEDREECWN